MPFYLTLSLPFSLMLKKGYFRLRSQPCVHFHFLFCPHKILFSRVPLTLCCHVLILPVKFLWRHLSSAKLFCNVSLSRRTSPFLRGRDMSPIRKSIHSTSFLCRFKFLLILFDFLLAWVRHDHGRRPIHTSSIISSFVYVLLCRLPTYEYLSPLSSGSRVQPSPEPTTK